MLIGGGVDFGSDWNEFSLVENPIPVYGYTFIANGNVSSTLGGVPVGDQDYSFYGYGQVGTVNSVNTTQSQPLVADPGGIKKLTGPLKWPCPPIPTHPSNVKVTDNINQAAQHNDGLAGDLWFYSQVTNFGPWDYKRQDPAYDDFGNFNFGATGPAVGFDADMLLRGAGAKKWWESKGSPYGVPWGGPPYGNQVGKQAWIQDGINYYFAKKDGCVDP
jgi:putative RNase toxin 44 of polymorphic toxin system